MGRFVPPSENRTVRVIFTRPDYTYVEQYLLADTVTGNFSVTQKLDMAGYWNIFPVDGHVSDRLFAEVTDPANPEAPPPSPVRDLNYKPNYTVIVLSAAVLSV